MAEFNNPIVRFNGVVYEAELMQIKSTHIGFEDHDIFTWNIQFEFGAGVQGTGHYGLDPLPSMQEMIKVLLNTVGVRTWKDMDGKLVYVLRDADDIHGQIRGIANVIMPDQKVVIFSDFYKVDDTASAEGEDEAA